MNDNRGDYPAINGMKLKEMLLEDWHPPDRETLVERFEERRAKEAASATAFGITRQQASIARGSCRLGSHARSWLPFIEPPRYRGDA